MKKTVLFFALLSSCALFSAPNAKSLSYINQWKQTALEQQKHYGIPASITMAQGLLESGAGQSELAINANNHFGIKCTSDWLGGSYYYDDDHKGECFRVYNNAEESFKDHSLFLRRDRYAALFELDIADYRRWANGLKACGYATDPSYATKLIAIIEDYSLDTLVGLAASMPVEPVATSVTTTAATTAVTAASTTKAKDKKKDTSMGEEWVEARTAKLERKAFYSVHPKERVNHTPYIFAREGDSYATIAYSLNMKERKLREYNDALGHILKPGDRVFTTAKPRYVRGIKSVMWVHPGESLWSISQREGVQLKTIYKLNEIDPSVKVFKTRQKVYLAKPKK
ncbi:MAG: glucosaminidase domain-containing protein [Paludibacteraceae bacterium]|nr:glucosaminidase domain-containing protein [Paludibacteraceae bacterium]